MSFASWQYVYQSFASYTDGVTPWQSGPTRTLRPVVKAILEAWEGW